MCRTNIGFLSVLGLTVFVSASVTPEAVVFSGTFQGTTAATDIVRPLNLDFPQWNSHAPLEDLPLTCQRPTTVSASTRHRCSAVLQANLSKLCSAYVPQVILSDDVTERMATGAWGEQLVNSFLCQWRDSGEPGRPANVLWCNHSGESGQPYDFKLTFRPPEAAAGEVYVEVKATVKKEKSFIQLSANEVDFALKEKERYHIFRVYCAGDAQNARLCRIQNLAQHLHTKNLALYLFV